MKTLQKYFITLLVVMISITGSAYNSTYDVKVGGTFTVYTTYKSNTISVLWTYDGTYLDPGYIGSESTSVTFKALKPTPASGIVIQSVTYYMQNGYSMRQVDDWLVHIDPIKVSSISITPSSSTLYVGQYVDLKADISPSNASNKEVKWTSLNTTVAQVNSNGRVEAKKTGTTKIRCTADDGSGKYGECTITVNDPIAVTGLKLNQTTVTMNVRDRYTLTHTISPSNATNKDVKWSTSKSSVATVIGGTITAVDEGEADIICTSVDNSSVSAKCHIVVKSVPVKSITLDCTSATLGLNEKKQINATILPTNATALTTKWESSKPSVAEVSQSGYVTAKSAGETTIRCYATDNSGVYATCKITVKSYKPTSISLPQSVTVGVKETVPLTCTIQPSNATTTLSWSSANEQIATVSNDGVVKGIKEGSTVITVKTAEGLMAKCNVTVKKIEFDHSVKWTDMGNYSIDWYDKNAKKIVISTNKQLAGLAYLVNNGYDDFKDKTIEITNDISLYGKNWTGIGNDKNSFKGSFQGNGNKIEDVTIGNPENEQKSIGFFGNVESNGYIRNFTLSGEIIINNPVGGCKHIGALIGTNKYPDNWLTISKIDCQMPISFSRDLSMTENEPSIIFGGLIGYGRRCDIMYCSYTGKISIDQYPSSAAFSSAKITGGGIVGDSENCCLSYCEARCSEISATCPTWNRSGTSSASMGTIELGGLCGNVSSWEIKYCLAIANFTVTHHGWPFTNSGYPNVYVGGLIGHYDTPPELYNNLAITSYVKKGATASVNLNYYDIPDKAKANESNYSNSDAQVTWSSYIKQNTHYGLRYKTSELKSQAFLDELNNYPKMKLGKNVWMINPNDGFPCVLEKEPITGTQDVVISAHAGRYHSIVVKSDGSLWSCGKNDRGQLGDSKTSDRNKFVKVMDDVASVYAGNDYSLVVKRDNSLWNFGDNSQGALGDGTSSHLYSPKKIMDNVRYCTGEYLDALYIKTDDSLWGSGFNQNGELGTGDTERLLSPSKIMDNVSSVSIQEHTLIVKKDGSLWGCGINSRGELGDGTTTDRLTPIKITDNVRSVDMGYLNSFVIKNDNSLWACGSNYSGQFGLGTTDIETTLVKIMDDVYKVTSGNSQSTFVIKNEGSLWACGKNQYGQLGDGTTNSRYTFGKIMDNVRDVTTDGSSTYIIKKDNSLWSCGDNYDGQLGDGTTIDRYTPVKIMDDVSTVSVYNVNNFRGCFCLIVKNDGSLWACGNNRFGQLGDGTTTNRATPVMIMEGDPSYTGIQDVVISTDEMQKPKAKNGVFSISGQRMSAPQKGLNIINGKKYVIK